MSFLEVRDLTVAYGAIQAVRGVTFNVEKGQIVSLIGSNGAGKTTTLRTISGLLRSVSGEVLLDGEPMHKMPAHEILRRGVAHSPEGRRLFARMTVEENLRLGAYTRDDEVADLQETHGPSSFRCAPPGDSSTVADECSCASTSSGGAPR